MIRILNKNDFESYLKLLGFLTTIGDVSKFNFNTFVELQNESNRTFVYEIDNKIIGCITILLEQKLSHSFSKVMHIEDVITHANYRGKGVASKLISHAIDIAKNNNCYKIILNCNNDNIDFYEKNGFIQNEFQMIYPLK